MLMSDSSNILARLLAGDTTAQPNYLYIEYQNVDNTSTSVQAPTCDTEDTIEYYTGLSGNNDILRVEVTLQPVVSGDEVTFSVVAGGSVGIHGVPFTTSSRSKIYGLALAVGVTSDYTHDVIFSRHYFDAADQIIKPSDAVYITYTVSVN